MRNSSIEGGPNGPEEETYELSLRPKRLREYIGQGRVTENLDIFVKAALRRNEALDHVLLYGPPGLGKCITADSLVVTGEGLVRFSDLLPDGFEPGAAVPRETRVFGVNGPETASHVYASGHVPTRRLRTRSGFVLEGTPHHPVLVATPDGPAWKPVGALTCDDYVAIARGTNMWGRPRTVTWTPGGARDRRARVEAVARATHADLSAALGRSPAVSELRRAVARGGAESPSFETGAHRLGLPFANGHAVRLAARPWDLVASPVPDGVREIAFDADLAYLLGVLVGDGHFETGANAPAFSITCAEPEMQQELRRISRRVFGRDPEPKSYGGRAARMDFSQSVGRVCLDLGALAVTARGKVVPSAVLAGTEEVAVGFLQGLFDADGSAWRDGYVELGTRSEALSRQVQLLLANFGVVARRKARVVDGDDFWVLFAGGRDAERFHELIGFRLFRKRERAAGLGARRRGWSRSDLVPHANAPLAALIRASRPHARSTYKAFDHVLRDERTPTRDTVARLLALLPESVESEPEYATLLALANPTIYWDRVASVEESEAEAFDFVVPGSHSFVANGFINHNTTLANICANEMGAEIKSTSGPVIEKSGDLAAILTNLKEGDVLFIDEIHRLNPAIEEVLYPAMEDFQLDIIIGQGPSARSIKLDLPRFTLVGATTRAGLVTAPLRGRFGIRLHLDFYPPGELEVIVKRSADILGVSIEDEGASEIARRSRGTPRIANRLLRRVRDIAEVLFDGNITAEVAREALNRLEIDTFGLDETDSKLLLSIIEKFGGGPVGLGTISASINEDKDAIEEMIEPYLIQIGFLNRTPRGRVATRAAYEHFGVTTFTGPPGGLFDDDR